MSKARDPKSINLIVVHCSATPNGKHVTADEIDRWHKARGFKRDMTIAPHIQPQLHHIGYHLVIYTSGAVHPGRSVREVGAHAAGYNTRSIGICLIGTDKFTSSQFASLLSVIELLKKDHPIERICGHRDLSPDLDGDGEIEPFEWLKTCPGFDVNKWLNNDPSFNKHDHLIPDVGMPQPVTTIYHTVQPGDTLWKISGKYGVKVERIKEMNSLSSDAIIIGQKLIVDQCMNLQEARK